MRVTFGIAFALLLAAAAPTSAHHAFAVEFDAKACADVTGVLTKVNYENPARVSLPQREERRRPGGGGDVSALVDVEPEARRRDAGRAECQPQQGSR